MSQLTVHISGEQKDAGLLTLPIDVYAPNGLILARGTVSPTRSANLNLPDVGDVKLDRVHVLAKLPNGTYLQQTAELHDGHGDTTLQLSQESPHEWLQWVTPFRSLSHLDPHSTTRSPTPRRIGKVWMTLWSLREGRWMARDVDATDRQRDAGIQQLAIDVPMTPHLLQIGGEEVAWRLISLPPGGKVRVALTRSATDEGDALEITIGRSHPDNELVMSYLARGAVAEAGRLAEAWDAADLMLYEKRQDPVSAAAAAYLLLKIKRLQERREWVENFVDWFPYMADGAIVSAALALQRKDAKESEIRSKLRLALSRGLPIFSLGASILVETMAAVHRGKKEFKSFHAAYLAAQAYARANCSKGAYFAFYGQSPAQPSWTPIYGIEGEPTAQPASAELAEAVFFARPLNSVQTGSFGSTRVSLPRASVSAELVNELRDKQRQNATSDFVRLRSGLSGLLFEPTVESGMPALETSFLEEFSAGSARGMPAIAKQDNLQPQLKSLPDRAQEMPRQTAKYWQDERQRHATTVFDGDE